MSLSATVRALVLAGATPEMILAVVEVWELENPTPTGRLAWFAAADLRNRVIQRDGLVCGYCGDSDGPFEVDHIDPLVRGGSNDLENLIVACRTCNRSKGGKTLEEWGGRRC